MSEARVAVVTGATSGLGRATAERLAATPGWRVVLAVRDSDRGAALARQLGPDAAVVALDLASLASVRDAAAHIADRYAPLSGLVLNAGVQLARTGAASADGHELTFAVNHLGHFLLANLLRPALADDARVVVVSSGTHWGTLAKSGPFPAPRWTDPRELARPRPGSGQRAYATSKLANVYFAYEAARRWHEVAVNVYDPGLLPHTRLARDYPPPARALYTALAPLMARLPFAQHPNQAAAQLTQLITDPSLAGVSGRYYERGQHASSSPESYDIDRALELWRASEDLTTTPTSR